MSPGGLDQEEPTRTDCDVVVGAVERHASAKDGKRASRGTTRDGKQPPERQVGRRKGAEDGAAAACCRIIGRSVGRRARLRRHPDEAELHASQVE